MKPLLFADTLAGAVAREILRGGPDGIAYKAAWDRQGSAAENHIAAARRDALESARWIESRECGAIPQDMVRP